MPIKADVYRLDKLRHDHEYVRRGRVNGRVKGHSEYAPHSPLLVDSQSHAFL